MTKSKKIHRSGEHYFWHLDREAAVWFCIPRRRHFQAIFLRWYHLN